MMESETIDVLPRISTNTAKKFRIKNVTSNSIQCFRAVRAERRANDLTVEALVRDVFNSAVSTASSLFAASVGWYAAYDKRQQRRRHHYRRAMNAVSAKRVAAQVQRVPALPVVTSQKFTDASFVHFADAQASALPNAVVSVSHAATPELPPAYVCADARRREACLAAS